MQEVFSEFLTSERIAVLSVLMPDGTVHGATMHFAHQQDPLTVIFLMGKDSRKMASLREVESAPASIVVGTEEALMKTLQLDGAVRLISDEKLQEVYFEKFPEKRAKFVGPNDVFVAFTPTWWRYSDYKAPADKKIITSE